MKKRKLKKKAIMFLVLLLAFCLAAGKMAADHFGAKGTVTDGQKTQEQKEGNPDQQGYDTEDLELPELEIETDTETEQEDEMAEGTIEETGEAGDGSQSGTAPQTDEPPMDIELPEVP